MVAKSIKSDEPQQTPSERLSAIGIDAICAEIAGGLSLRAWSVKHGFETSTVHRWIDSDDERAQQYARAREDREESIFESLGDIGDKAASAESAVEVAGLRLKSDNTKWMLARMSPKKYGEKLDVTSEVTVQTLSDDQLLAKAKALANKIGLSNVDAVKIAGE